MSRHHRSQHWSTFLRWRRPELEQQLPLPCISCGKPVLPDPLPRIGPTQWHVGHIVDAAKGGRPTRANTGPQHARCNLRAGGRAGAVVTNRGRDAAAAAAAERGVRRW